MNEKNEIWATSSSRKKTHMNQTNLLLIHIIEKRLPALFSTGKRQNAIIRSVEYIKKSTPMIETVVKRIKSKIREEGIEEGIEEGTINVARKLRAMGVSIPDIVEATGLPYEVVEKL